MIVLTLQGDELLVTKSEAVGLGWELGNTTKIGGQTYTVRFFGQETSGKTATGETRFLHLLKDEIYLNQTVAADLGIMHGDTVAIGNQIYTMRIEHPNARGMGRRCLFELLLLLGLLYGIGWLVWHGIVWLFGL